MNRKEAGERFRRLVFQWPGRSVSFAFPIIFLGVVALHALTFYGFQVVYPPVSSVSLPPGEVALIMPDRPEHQALLEWVDAQSPALAPRLQDQAPTVLGVGAYRPSYTAVQTLPKPAAFSRVATVFPAAYRPAALMAPKHPVREVMGQAVRTSLHYTGALAERAGEPPKLTFQRRSDGGLLPAVFLIGVSEHGRVLYSFLQESSGSAAMDAEAEEVVRRQRFAPQRGAVQWSRATFAWGGDVVVTDRPGGAVPRGEKGGGG